VLTPASAFFQARTDYSIDIGFNDSGFGDILFFKCYLVGDSLAVMGDIGIEFSQEIPLLWVPNMQ